MTCSVETKTAPAAAAGDAALRKEETNRLFGLAQVTAELRDS